MFSAMLMDAYRDECPGIRIAYRADGHLLNSQCMQAPTRVSTTTVHDLLFVDDCALDTVTEEDMQKIMVLFTAGCANFVLTISTAKTVDIHLPPLSADYNAPRINTERRPPPPMPSLPPRIHSPSGPARSHAHPRKVESTVISAHLTHP
ncbi:unnamed protein product [Schistocephalus solidus]|uniref:Reverse transcriptase domain-containing protein n=1 Tax=Schistocephalus solidus TaxID=70667 RepID=A0A183SEA3_SCHSO|nr:unnamed protein product [Schistocephalus solidus]